MVSNLQLKRYSDKVLEAIPRSAKQSLARTLRRASIELETSDIPLKEVNDLIRADDFDGAEKRLIQVLEEDPTNLRVMPYITRVRYLKQRATSLEAIGQEIEMSRTLWLMNKELQSKKVYSLEPKWQIGVDIQVQLLTTYGVENFKRTVSHCYQNFIMCRLHDPQVKQLLKTMQTHFTSEPWFNTIEVPDHVGLHDRIYDDPIETHFENPTYRLANPEDREVYRIAVGLLWEQVRATDPYHLLDTLEESEIGNPIRIWRKGKLISSDLAHSVRERNMLMEPLSLKGKEKLTVMEIGAGHGRLAEVFGKTTNYRYMIFDITPALYVAQWYISKLFPGEVFQFRHFDNISEIELELKESRFAFFTPNQIEMFPDGYFDLAINMNSLGEMRLDQVENYLHQIDRLTRRGFMSRQEFHEQSKNKWLEKFPKETFALPEERWRAVVDKVDDFHPYFFNQIWERKP